MKQLLVSRYRQQEASLKLVKIIVQESRQSIFMSCLVKAPQTSCPSSCHLSLGIILYSDKRVGLLSQHRLDGMLVPYHWVLFCIVTNV